MINFKKCEIKDDIYSGKDDFIDLGVYAMYSVTPAVAPAPFADRQSARGAQNIARGMVKTQIKICFF